MRTNRARVLIPLLCLAALLSSTVAGCGDNRRAESASRLKRLVWLTDLYQDDHAGHFPDLSSSSAAQVSLASSLAKASVATDADAEGGKWTSAVFTDPIIGAPFVPNANLSGIEGAKLTDSSTTIAFYAPAPDGDERLVGYADGHTAWVKESEWGAKRQ